MKQKHLIIILVAFCMLLLTTACGQTEDILLFSEETYQHDVICSVQVSAQEAAVITQFTEEMTKLCGTAPTLVFDIQKEQSKNPKIIIGTGVCSQINIPELGAQESYWSVDTTGKDIFISASTPSALKVAVEYFLSQCGYDKELKVCTISGDIKQEQYTQGYYRDGWLLTDIPSYWGDNELVATTYNCGTTLFNGNKNEDTVLLQTVKSTTAQEAETYAKLLEAVGYTMLSHRTVENNEFYRFRNDTTKISVNYYGNEEVADIIMDQSSIATLDLDYSYEPKSGERTEVYLYSLYRRHYDDATLNDSIAIRGGLSMVIKLADNSVIIIDGGESATQFKEVYHPDYLEFLYEITGTPKTEKIRVAAWYITHGHGDHANGMASFLMNNTAHIDLERVIGNFPDPDNVNTALEVLGNIRSAIQMYGCQEVKVHTGDVIQLADVSIEILYTHEDLATEAGIWASEDDNDASVACIFRTCDGMSFFLNGDMNMASFEAMEKNFSAKTLNTTLALVAHHLYNDLDERYYSILSPQFFLVGADSYNIPNSSVTQRQHDFAVAHSEAVYYEDDTFGFAFENGRAVLIYEKEMF